MNGARTGEREKEMLSERLELAKKASVFAHIQSRDPLGRAKVVLVPGHEGKRYRVILRWTKTRVSAECALDSVIGPVPCLGGSQTLCYHGLSAILAAFRDRNYNLAISENALGLKRLRSVGGVLIGLESWQSGKVVWALARRAKVLERTG